MSPTLIKYVALLLMVAQNCSVVLMMHYTRTSTTEKYYFTSAVLMAEIMKLVVCLILVFYETKNVNAFLLHMQQELVQKPWELAKISVPALLYTFQNNILYVAVENLEAAVFQVMYQLKILTTAVLSVWILSRPLSTRQWTSLLILFVGVAMVQLSIQQNEKEDVPASSKMSAHEVAMKLANPTLGLICVLMGTLSSGMAGVYFEKLLKTSSQTIWMRNIQLSVWGILIAALGMIQQNGSEIAENGILYGYNTNVWIVVILQAVGGLIVAVVVKYADNVMKGFATSIATVVNTVISMALFDFEPTSMFFFGALQVCAATYIYGTAQPLPAPQSPQPSETSQNDSNDKLEKVNTDSV